MQNPFANRWVFSLSCLFAAGIALAFIANIKIFLIVLAIFLIVVIALYLAKKPKKYLILGLICFAAGGFLLLIRQNAMQVKSLPEKADVLGYVAQTPRYDGRQTMVVLNHNTINGVPIDHAISVYIDKEIPVEYGQHVQLTQVKLKQPQSKRNPGGNDSRISSWSKNIALTCNASVSQTTIWQGKGSITREILRLRKQMENALEAQMDPQSFGAMKGILFGDTSEMPQEWVDSFQITGITHVLAVSGQHVSILTAALLFLLSPLKRKWITAIVVSLIILAFCVMAGFSASVLRAALMGIVLIIGKTWGEKVDTLTLLGLSAFILLLFNPFQLFSLGFLLSYAAVLGIVAFYTRPAAFLRKKKILKPIRFVLDAALLSYAAQLAVLPVLLQTFGTLPALSIIVNVLITPFVSISVISGFVAAILGSIWLPLGFMPAKITQWCMGVIQNITMPASQFQFATVVIGALPIIALIGLLFVLFAHLQWIKKKQLIVCAGLLGAFLCIVGMILQLQMRKDSMEVTFLDVGQGDAIYIRQGETHVLLDGGNKLEQFDNGERVVLPFLRVKGVAQLDAVIASHQDADHVGGLARVVHAVPTKQFLASSVTMQADDATYIALMNEISKRNTRITLLQTGDKFQIAQANVQVFAPERTGLIGNDASLVLYLSYNGSSILFTGDAGIETEQLMLDNLPECMVLKVAHHGSKYSSSEAFLQAIRPKLAILSVGKNNTYGHPAPQVLQGLQDVSSQVLRTDQDGAITLLIDSRGIRIQTMKSER